MLDLLAALWRRFWGVELSIQSGDKLYVVSAPDVAAEFFSDSRPDAALNCIFSALLKDSIGQFPTPAVVSQWSLSDKKAVFEAIVRRHSQIDGATVFSRQHESAFVDTIRRCASEDALGHLAHLFINQYKTLNSALLLSYRASATFF